MEKIMIKLIVLIALIPVTTVLIALSTVERKPIVKEVENYKFVAEIPAELPENLKEEITENLEQVNIETIEVTSEEEEKIEFEVTEEEFEVTDETE
jgi:hypothetical protein